MIHNDFANNSIDFALSKCRIRNVFTTGGHHHSLYSHGFCIDYFYCLLACLFCYIFFVFFVQVRSWNDLPTYQSYNYRTKNQHEKKRENDCGCCLLFCRVIKFWILFCSSIYLYNIYICFDSKYKNGLVYVEIYVSFFLSSLSVSLCVPLSHSPYRRCLHVILLFELWECSWYMYTKWKWNGGMTRAQRKGHFENEPNINTGKNYK